jgi:predicted membrane protein
MEIKKRRSKIAGRIVWGLAFFLAGVAIILNLAGVFAVPSGLSAGDVIWTAVLALIILWSIPHRFWFFTFFALAGVGFVWREQICEQIGVEKISAWPIIGAVLLLSIGFHILFKSKKHYDWIHENEGEWGIHGRAKKAKKVEGGIFTESSENDSEVFIKSSFGATIKYVNTQSLKRATLDCSFGAIKAFFDNATVHEDGAVIEIFNSFGGVELYIPRTWRLVDDMDRTLGGVDIKNPDFEQASGPIVTLRGSVKLGGVEIIYV